MAEPLCGVGAHRDATRRRSTHRECTNNKPRRPPAPSTVPTKFSQEVTTRVVTKPLLEATTRTTTTTGAQPIDNCKHKERTSQHGYNNKPRNNVICNPRRQQWSLHHFLFIKILVFYTLCHLQHELQTLNPNPKTPPSQPSGPHNYELPLQYSYELRSPTTSDIAEASSIKAGKRSHGGSLQQLAEHQFPPPKTEKTSRKLPNHQLPPLQASTEVTLIQLTHITHTQVSHTALRNALSVAPNTQKLCTDSIPTQRPTIRLISYKPQYKHKRPLTSVRFHHECTTPAVLQQHDSHSANLHKQLMRYRHKVGPVPPHFPPYSAVLPAHTLTSLNNTHLHNLVWAQSPSGPPVTQRHLNHTALKARSNKSLILSTQSSRNRRHAPPLQADTNATYTQALHSLITQALTATPNSYTTHTNPHPTLTPYLIAQTTTQQKHTSTKQRAGKPNLPPHSKYNEQPTDPKLPDPRPNHPHRPTPPNIPNNRTNPTLSHTSLETHKTPHSPLYTDTNITYTQSITNNQTPTTLPHSPSESQRPSHKPRRMASISNCELVYNTPTPTPEIITSQRSLTISHTFPFPTHCHTLRIAIVVHHHHYRSRSVPTHCSHTSGSPTLRSSSAQHRHAGSAPVTTTYTHPPEQDTHLLGNNNTLIQRRITHSPASDGLDAPHSTLRNHSSPIVQTTPTLTTTAPTTLQQVEINTDSHQ